MAAVQPGGPYPPLLQAGYPSPVLGGYLTMPAGPQLGLPQPQPPPPRLARQKGGESATRLGPASAALAQLTARSLTLVRGRLVGLLGW